MNHSRRHACAICGEEQHGNETRFLVAESRWDDKLMVLEWNEQMASRVGIHVACGVNHVEELVVHWMTTGSLDYPFARASLGSRNWQRRMGPDYRIDLSGARMLGELAVHRDSVERVLAENPQSLQVILDALVEALQRETINPGERTPQREERLRDEQEVEEEFSVVSSKA
jgi:hypothetical protein